MASLKDEVLAALAKVASPQGQPLTETGTLSDVVVTDGKVFFSISVDAGAVKQWETVRARAEAATRAVPGVQSVLVALTAERASGVGGTAPQRRPQMPPAAARPREGGTAPSPAGIPGVAAIIAVASGKGGVGKSTTAVNLALGLRDLGLKVGILDADIYGPSMPKLLAIREKPQTIGGNRLKPIDRHGMPVMSIGFLIEEKTPMIWRGPMKVMSALTQMLREVEWSTLDVMVGTCRPAPVTPEPTMAQQVPLKGRGHRLHPAGCGSSRRPARHRHVPPGQCAGCSASSRTCRPSSTRTAAPALERHSRPRRRARRAERLGVPFLGEVPLHMDIREKSDSGQPVVASVPDDPHAQAYRGHRRPRARRLAGGKPPRAQDCDRGLGVALIWIQRQHLPEFLALIVREPARACCCPSTTI